MSVITVVNWLIKKKVFLQSLILHEYRNNICKGNNMVHDISCLCGKHIMVEKKSNDYFRVSGVPRTTYFHSHLGFMQNPRSSTGYFQQLIKSNILGATQPRIHIYKYNIVYRLPPESRNRFRRRLQLFPPHVIPVYYTPCITSVL